MSASGAGWWDVVNPATGESYEAMSGGWVRESARRCVVTHRLEGVAREFEVDLEGDDD